MGQRYTSWQEFFTTLMNDVLRAEQTQRIPWAAQRPDFETLVNFTMPHLLQPLEENTTRIQPCLIHGNLSVQNAGITSDTNQAIIFNPIGLYAHNEYELGKWRSSDGIPDFRSYLKEYRRHFSPAAPADQWNDRICLYSLKFSLDHLLTQPEAVETQSRIVEDVRLLNEKYGDQGS
ncbi:hypothetical protein BX600DRAFT_515439 [Xylariales sp. PMI_506]|nr:hypothetical protein BX600DRAFT_515439 [Xylariales sp. PMI_506]